MLIIGGKFSGGYQFGTCVCMHISELASELVRVGIRAKDACTGKSFRSITLLIGGSAVVSVAKDGV